MTDQSGTPPFAVYWRARDGQGTHTWKTGLTDAEATAEIRWCEGAHPEATIVWVTEAGASRAREVRQRPQVERISPTRALDVLLGRVKNGE
jgi:hypothetical protein